MTEVAAAEGLILRRMGSFPSRGRALGEAVDTVLRQDVYAERDQPPFDRVTMDGIAFAYRDWAAGMRTLRVVGTQGAGAPPLALAGPGECVEIMTGAVLPEGADTVVPVERITRQGAEAAIADPLAVTRHQFIHARGSDRKSGSLLLPSGGWIGPTEVAVLASAGCAEIQVTEPPRVAVISTGDELVDVGDPIEPHQIRSSNDRAIEASLLHHHLARVTRRHIGDDRQSIREGILRCHEDNDVLILSGGVSMGEYDYVPRVLEELGVELVFHRIEQRPGRPMWFGVSGDSKPVFALPGNPVSTLVCLTRYVIPALRTAMGLAPTAAEMVRLSERVEFPANLTYFLPVRVRWDDGGVPWAEPRPTNTSGDFVSLVGTQGFVELARGADVYPEGTVARLFRW